MAITTTTVRTNRILAEVIHERNLDASYPNLVATAHCSVDSIAGENALAKAYPRLGDEGAAADLTEGTTLSTVTTEAQGVQLVNTPAEIGDRRDLTYRAIRRAMGGAADIETAIANGNMGAVVAALADSFMAQRKMILEALEVKVMALIDDFSTSVGSTGVDPDLSQAESAIFEFGELETAGEEQAVFLLANRHLSDLRREIGITSGGNQGAVWSGDVQSIMSVRPELSTTGLAGALFGVPAYRTSTSVNPSPNAGADEASALLASGGMRGPDDQPGALLITEGDVMRHRWEDVVEDRAVKVVSVWEVAAGERADDMGVSWIADA